jgi:hypothetical protein
MLNILLLSLLAAVLLVPPLVLSRYKANLSWVSRYCLATLPVAYTWAGWKTALVAYGFLGCQGGSKNLQGCLAADIDWTPLVGYGFFLMIPCLYIAAPLSLWLLLTTVVKQVTPGSTSL